MIEPITQQLGSPARYAYRVLLFGPEARTCGKSEVLLPSDVPALLVSDIKATLIQVEPALAATVRSARLAVNHAFAAETAMVRPQDEIALIGMVSGG